MGKAHCNARLFQPAHVSHLFDCVQSLLLTFSPSHLQMILESITVAMQEPFSCAEETARLERSDANRETNAHSLIHGLDAVLRSTVGQMMAANDSEWKAKHSGLMSRVKSIVMNKMRVKIMKEHPKQSPEEYKEQTVSLFRQLLTETAP
ncbi:hypothetical protein P879_07952 [Paragonimus westermani]|uniref:Uncharacterized protein n=1 Tax=Paragonimus westermani TaxID=34504 RepID=A0A8T0DPX2_9TREM|nr:hypothetical protein P879_07952 [Paragonimus westermani]